MPSDELAAALESLKSSSTFERLQAARTIRTLGNASLVPLLKMHQAREADSWVLRAIDRAIFSWSNPTSTSGIELDFFETSADAVLDIRASTLQSGTRVLLHEMKPLVRRIDIAAREELGADFETSKTKAALDRQRSFLKILESVSEASGAPVRTEIDLTDTVAFCVSQCGFSSEEVLLARAEPVSVQGDSNLLALALPNIIRNAVEAQREVRPEGKVLINWGTSDSEAWVAVMDEGPGLPSGADNATLPGITSKKKSEHFGWGLTIAAQAMSSLGGSLIFVPRDPSGTMCEIRWPLKDSRD